MRRKILHLIVNTGFLILFLGFATRAFYESVVLKCTTNYPGAIIVTAIIGMIVSVPGVINGNSLSARITIILRLTQLTALLVCIFLYLFWALDFLSTAFVGVG
ncbi:MAG: hypothetical protein WCM76_09940 [Bacteroidota bacterium]